MQDTTERVRDCVIIKSLKTGLYTYLFPVLSGKLRRKYFPGNNCKNFQDGNGRQCIGAVWKTVTK